MSKSTKKTVAANAAAPAIASNGKRVFTGNGQEFADIEGKTPDEVRKVYAVNFPWLAEASVKGPVTRNDGTQEFTFGPKLGPKG
ncbi:MAG: PRTRC system protein C, partial [Victivallaceae bacterium]|nr:PRTRC system protein C [Victivallaceae bacterium]